MGRLALAREIAARGHYPAIDVLKSVSRCMSDIVPRQHLRLARRMQELMAVYDEARDLINIGAYVSGNNPAIDTAIAHHDQIMDFLKQAVAEPASIEDSVEAMQAMLRLPEES